MITLKDIADRVGTSTATVSRVLNDKGKGIRLNASERANTIKLVAKEMGYWGDDGTSVQKSQSKGSIAFLVKDRHSRIFDFEYYEGLSQGLAPHGYTISLITLSDLELYHDKLPSPEDIGLAIVRHLPEEWRQALGELGQRCIWLDTNEWQPQGCLRRDEYGAGEIAAQQILARGYQQVVYIGGSGKAQAHFNEMERWLGVSKTLDKAGMPLVRFGFEYGQANEELGNQVLRLLSPKTAVISADTNVATWAHHRFTPERQISGLDYGLVSLCSNQSVKPLWPALSHVSFDRFGLALKAVKWAVDVLDEGKELGESEKMCGEWMEGKTLRTC